MFKLITKIQRPSLTATSRILIPPEATRIAGSFNPAFLQFRPQSSDTSPKEETFAALFRNCKFTQMGDPEGATVVGKIYHVVDNDLYIDFGHKFPCVCERPRDKREKYVRGAEVLLKIKSLELSQKFLGYDKDLTLLEADCDLIGLKN
eukprot:TRINITY_DN43170_c0_g1_i1.p1 TRINITY_DN43170_c0_g1~~TRINITY_DN43170_c0_g1_i1.p1  ORF type:complete len:148 (+),score=6.59 TRINITY_DN43170_c0_g1_i1:44-487(+)